MTPRKQPPPTIGNWKFPLALGTAGILIALLLAYASSHGGRHFVRPVEGGKWQSCTSYDWFNASYACGSPMTLDEAAWWAAKGVTDIELKHIVPEIAIGVAKPASTANSLCPDGTAAHYVGGMSDGKSTQWFGSCNGTPTVPPTDSATALTIVCPDGTAPHRAWGNDGTDLICNGAVTCLDGTPGKYVDETHTFSCAGHGDDNGMRLALPR